jgi:hypothetical protein
MVLHNLGYRHRDKMRQNNCAIEMTLSVAKIIQLCQHTHTHTDINVYWALVEWYWRRKVEVHWEKLALYQSVHRIHTLQALCKIMTLLYLIQISWKLVILDSAVCGKLTSLQRTHPHSSVLFTIHPTDQLHFEYKPTLWSAVIHLIKHCNSKCKTYSPHLRDRYKWHTENCKWVKIILT